MPCFIVGIAFFFPRLVLILLFFFTTFITSAFQTLLWPVLGFIFMPYTTLAYAGAMNYGGGSVSGLWLILVVVGVLLDLGVLGGSGASASRTYSSRNRRA
jgi:hypothetical protein